jgi:hypothetical protein
VLGEPPPTAGHASDLSIVSGKIVTYGGLYLICCAVRLR